MAELPDDGEQHREVYARYGLAVYFAQVFEHSLANLLAMAERASGALSAEEVDEYYERIFRRNTSELVKRIGAQGWLTTPEFELCQRALRERNRLAHDYFRDHAQDFVTPIGRQRMLDDVDEARQLFLDADAACERALYEAGAPHGVTRRAVELMAHSLRPDSPD